MKKYSILLLLGCLSTTCFPQINELGLFIGGVNYIGDVGRTNYIQPNEPGGTIVYKYNLNPRIALRGTLSSFSLFGDDVNSENTVRKARGFRFKNPINEISLGIEYNFFEYDISTAHEISTPYILLQVAAVDYETPRIQNESGDYSFTRNTALAIPFGIGWKTKLYGKVAFAAEISFRYSFTDELDYSTQEFTELDFGGTSNDWYSFSGVSLVYTFGRPPCFADRK